MSATLAEKRTPSSDANDPTREQNPDASDVLVCIGREHHADPLIPHAKAVARAFGGNVVLLHVIEPPANGITQVDPVDWDIRRREAMALVTRLAQKFDTDTGGIGVKVMEGRCVEQICKCLSSRPQDIAAVSRQRGPDGWHAGEMMRGVAASDLGSILMVPSDGAGSEPLHYTRILVPLDGSPRAESAVPKAVKLARVYGAELILCHVTPEPVLTEIGAVQRDAISLKDQITQRNKIIGQTYLNSVKNKLAECGVSASAKITVGGDVRRALMEAIQREAADLVVIASHGQSGHADVPAGDVANFILERSDVPVLMFRQSRPQKDQHVFGEVRSEGIRHPADLEK